MLRSIPCYVMFVIKHVMFMFVVTLYNMLSYVMFMLCLCYNMLCYVYVTLYNMLCCYVI